LYGDLDLSVLDELPPGRTPIVTRRVSDERSPEVWDFVRKQVAAGHQAYVVYPVIEENEERELKAALKMYKELSNKIFADLKVGLLHGRLDNDLKEQVMRRFASGELNILVATTVIEVGVDVPNATIMIVQEADRFGLAQLHQLRGRVGRGVEQSYCLLISRAREDLTEPAIERLEALVRTNDGFELAEVDLDIRGSGQLLGTRQSGLTDLRFAHLRKDRPLLERARALADELVETKGPLSDEVERAFAGRDLSAA
jgi:ATP-dependent DNA helicase RecG